MCVLWEHRDTCMSGTMRHEDRELESLVREDIIENRQISKTRYVFNQILTS